MRSKNPRDFKKGMIVTCDQFPDTEFFVIGYDQLPSMSQESIMIQSFDRFGDRWHTMAEMLETVNKENPND